MPRTPGPAVRAAVVDVACVVAFAAAGRSSHAEDGGVVGVLGTALPFLLAAAAGWVLARRQHPVRPWPAGVVVWAVTWVGGIVLRALGGDGIAPPFVAVAGVVLAVLLIGWRAVATAVSLAWRRRQPAGSARAR